MTQPEKRFDLDLKFGQEGEAIIQQFGDERKFEVKRDRLWSKTGNLFIETACSGKPSGLMATESDYMACLLDHRGTVIGGLFFDANRLKTSLATLFREGHLKKMIGGDGKRAEGYLLPLRHLDRVFILMADKHIDKPTPSDNKQPIVITTDGSFRDGGYAGGHIMIERHGSAEKRDDFFKDMTWQTHLKDSYEAELSCVLEALKYIQRGHKLCVLHFRCDHQGIVDTLNKMGEQMQKRGHIEELSNTMPCYKMWNEIIDRIQIHSFGAEHFRYNKDTPESVRVHEEAFAASNDWKQRVQERKGRKIE